jgi:hypothetical protein
MKINALNFKCRYSIAMYEGGPILKVQVSVIHGLHATSRCHLHVLVRRVEGK